MAGPTVFISYAHNDNESSDPDERWLDRMREQLAPLERQGLVSRCWSDKDLKIGDEWSPEIQGALDSAQVAILLVSPAFLASDYIANSELPVLLRKAKDRAVAILPVVLRSCLFKETKYKYPDSKKGPHEFSLASLQAANADTRPLEALPRHEQNRVLLSVAQRVLEIATPRGDAAPHLTPTLGQRPEPEVALGKLPVTSPDLFGRDDELATLDAAWGDPATNLVTVVAWGGVGKTALVNAWLGRLRSEHYRGAESVYGWSFYSQGAAEGRQVSADPFIAAALTWFGDEDPTSGSPWDKGRRLAELVRKRRTLIVLDGLEPLQNPPGVEEGHIKDVSLESFLRELAWHNIGLCVVTSRLRLADTRTGRAVRTIQLDRLSREAGAAYLRKLRVKGSKRELQEAVDDFRGHALALTLLGNYLRDDCDGDVRKRDEIGHLTDEEQQGGHARRVMASYEKWLEGKPALDVLRIMGLFDRPAEGGAIAKLREPPAIEGLTSALQDISQRTWDRACGALRRAGLLAAKDSDDPGKLDCHPLVREYFGEKLENENPAAWKEAHGRLYDYFKAEAKEYPDTVEEMAPLYAAVAHGCQAGRHQEALDEVYWTRMQRGEEHFHWHKLGAFGADLAVLAGFFDPPWGRPVETLSKDDRSFLLNEAGFDLRALGRLAEAVEPMQAALAARIEQKNWKNAARVANNLSELHLTLGEVGRAVDYAEQGVTFADRSGDAEMRMIMRTALADAYHQAGRVANAEALFREAEAMQKDLQPEYPLLYSVRAYRYCELLLAQAKWREVQDRAGKTVGWATQERVLLDIALDHLSLGRACLMEAEQEGTGDYGRAADEFDRAVDGLREAGQQDDLPRGLLARAGLHRVRGALDRAERDLAEVMEIATRGQMLLHQADAHIEYARLYFAMGDAAKARDHLATAKAMVAEMGYGRRVPEIEELEKE